MSENRLSPKSHVFFIIFLIELVVSAIAPYVLGPFEVTYNSAIAAADHAEQWEVTVPGKVRTWAQKSTFNAVQQPSFFFSNLGLFSRLG